MQRIARTFAAGIALILVFGTGLCQAQDDAVMATVNGQPIDADTLTNELYRRWGDIALGGLIQELAVKQAAAEAGVTITDDEVEDRAERFQRNIDMKGSQNGQNFSMWLAQQKMTPYAFHQWIRTELLLEKIVADEAVVTDEEVQEFWEEEQERFRQPERMRVSHICVSEKSEAEQIRAAIIAGEQSFEDAAREHSLDPYTRDEGGAFGAIERGDSDFQKAAFALQDDNAMSDPVQSEKGWHIIRRDDYLPESTPEFDEIEDQLRQQLKQQKLMVLMNNKRSEIMRNARIEQELDPRELASE
ncbi:MAG: peptidyl-prolyl cis-trans isomerase [Armatimonadota bacterium]